MSLKEKVDNKLKHLKKKRLINQYDGQLSFDIEKAIIISGMPRGGSTWFAELMRTLPKSSLLWEPLHLEFYPRFDELGFKWRQFLDVNNTDPVIKEAFTTVMQGNHLTEGLMQRTEVEELTNADFLIIKFCRANRLLPWLTHNYDFRKVIHLLRHPCAVIASQLKFGAWDDVGNKFTEEELKPDGYIEHYSHITEAINSPVEKLAAIWCLDNLVPLKASKKKWVTITYENLLKNPEIELNKIGIEFPETTLLKITQPSSTTKKGSPINNNNIEEQLSYWKKSLTNEQISAVLNILEKFEIDIYSDNIYPNGSY